MNIVKTSIEPDYELFTQDIAITPNFDDLNFVEQTHFEIENEDAPLVQPGDVVYCTDDFNGKKYEAIYIGWYEDFNQDGDTSPYFSEAYEGVHRLMVMRLHDGGCDYVLPQLCYSELQISKYYSVR